MNEPVRCAVCQSTNTGELLKAFDHLTGDEFAVFRCTNCDGAFTVPVPASLDRYYPPSYRNYRSGSRKIFEFMYRLQTAAGPALSESQARRSRSAAAMAGC
jgi:hypothetical protein